MPQAVDFHVICYKIHLPKYFGAFRSPEGSKEQWFQKGLQMSLLHNLNIGRMKKFMREFPWLWAIKTHWEPEERITVMPTDLRILGMLICMSGCSSRTKWWLHLVSPAGDEKVVTIQSVNNDPVTAIRGGMLECWACHHIVWQVDGPHPTILRPVGYADFNEIIFSDALRRLAAA